MINTLAPERAYAVIDEKRHDYRLLQDFGAIERHEFTRLTGEYQELSASEKKLSREKGNRLDEVVDWLFEKVLVNPGKLREQLAGANPETGLPRLTGTVKEQVVNAFFNTPEARMVQAQMMQALLASLAEDETPTASTSTS